jgi:WhiB family redox-sensing transcriptional regulator
MLTSYASSVEWGQNVTITDISWRQKGACQGLDPAVFFPDEGDEVAALVAISVCGTCDVRIACLEHALASREKEGVWGGTTERERRRIIRQRRRTA